MPEQFSEDVIHEAGERQDWLCGLCGAVLDDPDNVVEHDGHHITGEDEEDAEMDVENCVLLCRETDRNCHLLLHGGHFGDPPILNYEFRFWNGDPEESDDDEDGEDGD